MLVLRCVIGDSSLAEIRHEQADTWGINQSLSDSW